MPGRKNTVFQFKVQLKEITPAIWRRIQVPRDYSFWDLHVAIQDVMGWFDCHLHIFRKPYNTFPCIDSIGIPDEDRFVDDPKTLPGWKVKISRHFKKRLKMLFEGLGGI